MKSSKRVSFTSSERQELWQRWRHGKSLSNIGRSLERHAATIYDVLACVSRVRDTKPIKAICDRGCRGIKNIGETEVVLPSKALKRDSRYQRDKKLKQCRRRAAIEPIIGHLKASYRLSRNYLKGHIGDEINLLMAACAWNMKKWMNKASSIFFTLKLVRILLAQTIKCRL